jgi:hypothetical protein
MGSPFFADKFVSPCFFLAEPLYIKNDMGGGF